MLQSQQDRSGILYNHIKYVFLHVGVVATFREENCMAIGWDKYVLFHVGAVATFREEIKISQFFSLLIYSFLRAVSFKIVFSKINKRFRKKWFSNIAIMNYCTVSP